MNNVPFSGHYQRLYLTLLCYFGYVAGTGMQIWPLIVQNFVAYINWWLNKSIMDLFLHMIHGNDEDVCWNEIRDIIKVSYIIKAPNI